MQSGEGEKIPGPVATANFPPSIIVIAAQIGRRRGGASDGQTTLDFPLKLRLKVAATASSAAGISGEKATDFFRF